MGAAVTVAEVDLSEGVGGGLLEFAVCGALLLGVEEAGGVLGRQGEGEVAHAGVVGGAGCGGEAEAGADVDHEAGRGGSGFAGLGPDLRLPPAADLGPPSGPRGRPAAS